MPLIKAVAYSQIDDSLAAGKFVMEAVIKQLKGQRPDFLFLFATVGHDLPKVLQGVQTVAGEIPLCGCSGLGTITQLGCDEANFSVALMGLKSEEVFFHPFIVPGLSADSEAVGSKIGEKIKSIGLTPSDRQLLFLFPDGLMVNPVALYKGLESSAYHIDCVGGTAGNDFHISKTYQFCNQEILSDSVAGVLISGAFRYRISVSHGSKPIGNFKTVTQAEANVIYKIDEQPALTVLESIVGAERLSDFGQAINLITLGQALEDKGYAETLISRAIIGLSQERRSIKVGVEMPVGSVFQMLRRNPTKVQQGTQEMARQVIDRLLSPETAAYFYFNSSGRGSYLFGEPESDVNNLLEVLGKDKELIGFFTFGEMAPVSGENHFHNYTGILVGME